MNPKIYCPSSANTLIIHNLMMTKVKTIGLEWNYKIELPSEASLPRKTAAKDNENKIWLTPYKKYFGDFIKFLLTIFSKNGVIANIEDEKWQQLFKKTEK